MSFKYYNFVDVFNKSKIDKLLFYRFYDYKIKLVNKKIKIKLSRYRIYLRDINNNRYLILIINYNIIFDNNINRIIKIIYRFLLNYTI